MQETITLGLRDRKRQETRERLERAAVQIVLDDGLEHLTIDAISEQADVSPRTFFNYFDSKEDAILGLPLADDTERLITEALEGIHPASLLEGILELLTTIMHDPVHDPALRDGRRRIVHEHPELLHRQFTQMNRMLDTLTGSVHTLMARTGHAGDDQATASVSASAAGDHDPRPCTDAQAQVLLMTCGAALRAATAEVSHERAVTDPDESIERIQKRAVTLIKETVRKLQ